MTVTGRQLVAEAERWFGVPYVFGSEDAPHSWDCSEYMQFLGDRLLGPGIVPDGAYNQWRWCELISVEKALEIPGASLYIGDGTGVGRDSIWHTALSRGDRTTAEARSTRYGTGSWSAVGRFDFGGLWQHIAYGSDEATADRVEAVLRRIVRHNPRVRGLTKIESGSRLVIPHPDGSTSTHAIGKVGEPPISLRAIARRFVDQFWADH